jgi:hypothetical protein
MKIGVGGKFGPVRGGVSTRGFGGGFGPVKGGGKWPRAGSGAPALVVLVFGGMLLLLAGLVAFTVLAWPWRVVYLVGTGAGLGAWLAIALASLAELAYLFVLLVVIVHGVNHRQQNF